MLLRAKPQVVSFHFGLPRPEVIDAINHALRNIPPERVRMHVCWGNYEGPHDCDVPLQDIIPVLARAKVGGFVLPFANPRHEHEFRYAPQILRDDDQIIVAGVIVLTVSRPISSST